MRIVLDTNIVVSRSISPDRPSTKLYTYWHAAAFEVVVSKAILIEYRAALSKPRVRTLHHFSDEEIEQTIEDFRELALVIEPTAQMDAAGDVDDNKFLECAYSGNAEYIISGDPHLLNLKVYQGIALLPPSVFVRLLEREAV
jgi:uncharacterized protein